MPIESVNEKLNNGGEICIKEKQKMYLKSFPVRLIYENMKQFAKLQHIVETCTNWVTIF